MGNTSSTKTAPVPSPTIPLLLVGDLTTVPTHTLRRRSVSNLLRIGVGVQEELPVSDRIRLTGACRLQRPLRRLPCSEIQHAQTTRKPTRQKPGELDNEQDTKRERPDEPGHHDGGR